MCLLQNIFLYALLSLAKCSVQPDTSGSNIADDTRSLEHETVDESVDKLFQRGLKAWTLHHADLEKATLAKTPPAAQAAEKAARNAEHEEKKKTEERWLPPPWMFIMIVPVGMAGFIIWRVLQKFTGAKPKGTDLEAFKENLLVPSQDQPINSNPLPLTFDHGAQQLPVSTASTAEAAKLRNVDKSVQQHDENTPEAAMALANLGMTDGDKGELAKAAKLQNVDKSVQQHDENTPEAAMELANLGMTYGDKGEFSKQAECMQRALNILEHIYGPDHPKVALTLGGLADAYGNLGDIEKKRQLLERALIIEERSFGANDPEIGVTLVNLGVAYGDQGNAQKKKNLLERALGIFESAYGPNHLKLQ